MGSKTEWRWCSSFHPISEGTIGSRKEGGAERNIWRRHASMLCAPRLQGLYKPVFKKKSQAKLPPKYLTEG